MMTKRCADIRGERHFSRLLLLCLHLCTPSSTIWPISPVKVITWLSPPTFVWTEWLDYRGEYM